MNDITQVIKPEIAVPYKPNHQPVFADSEDYERNKRIREAIMQAGDAFREKHPWIVKYQDQIGMGIMLASIAGVATNTALYAAGKMPWYLTVPLNAFWMSLSHELEHDLIHLMYFRKNPKLHQLMLAGVYALRPSTINPWLRRQLHLHHHKSSGTETDLEERGITNGERWGLKRLLMTGDNIAAFALRPFKTLKMNKLFLKSQTKMDSTEKSALARKLALGYFPVGNIHYGLWYSFLALKAASLLDIDLSAITGLKSIEKLLTLYAVGIAAPNFLRTFSLHFVSSNMHYYGDVEDGNVVQQCQVWTDKRLAPLHAFCFNFGATHAIHHFVVRDPFYIRQAIAKDCYPTMAQNGVRFNDFGTFKRSNRRLTPV